MLFIVSSCPKYKHRQAFVSIVRIVEAKSKVAAVREFTAVHPFSIMKGTHSAPQAELLCVNHDYRL